MLLSILAALGGCAAHDDPPVDLPPAVATYDGEGCVLVEESTTECVSGANVQLEELFAPWTCDVDVHAVNGDGTLTTVRFQIGETSPACGYPVSGVDLLLATHQAAADEVKHAEECWRLAERFGTPPVRAMAFPFDDVINPRASLAELATATVREGCLAETLGAHLAAVAAERAADPEVKRVLRDIAEEEGRHSVSSFRIVAWALQAGGPEVRAAIEAALAEPWPQVDVAELALRTGLPPTELARVATQGVAEVLVPAVRRR